MRFYKGDDCEALGVQCVGCQVSLRLVRDLEALLFHRDPDWLPERLRGWRRAEVGEALLAHKAGFS